MTERILSEEALKILHESLEVFAVLGKDFTIEKEITEVLGDTRKVQRININIKTDDNKIREDENRKRYLMFYSAGLLDGTRLGGNIDDIEATVEKGLSQIAGDYTSSSLPLPFTAVACYAYDYVHKLNFYYSLPTDEEGRWVQTDKRSEFDPFAKDEQN